MTQNRAIRYFLGVHRFTPLLAINGDMGWIRSSDRRWVAMIRLWNRLVDMDHTRLTKRIFDADINSNGSTWSSEVKNIFEAVNMDNIYVNKETCDPASVRNALITKYDIIWRTKITTIAKLRTYVTIKHAYKTELYVKSTISKQARSHLAQLRCGVLPLNVETGRYTGLPPEQRICKMCNQNTIEDETHFILNCDKYQIERIPISQKLSNHPEITTDSEKLNFILNTCFKAASTFIIKAFTKRRSILYQ